MGEGGLAEEGRGDGKVEYWVHDRERSVWRSVQGDEPRYGRDCGGEENVAQRGGRWTVLADLGKRERRGAALG